MIKKFLPWFTVILVTIVTIGIFVAKLAMQSVDAEIIADEKLSVKLASQFFEDAVSMPATHLRSLVLFEQGVQRAINSGTAEAVSLVSQDFQTLLLRNPTYSQIRWIGNDGMELVRVDRFEGATLRIRSGEELQDKSGRPYVEFGKKLGPDELYVSPLDLNIENGKVNIPYEPTIRMAMQLFDKNNASAGIMVLNISVKDILVQLEQYLATGDLLLLNQDGYWLVGPKPEDEWGFMFNKTENFATRFPDAWHQIVSNPEGSGEAGSALYTWQSISIKTKQPHVKYNIALKSVAVLPATLLAAARWSAGIPIIYTALVLILTFGTGLYLLIKEIENRRQAQLEASRANQAKSSFLAIMSHEIRTPMTGVLGFADMLMEDGLPKDSQKKVARIKSSTKSLLSIINDILDISKLDAGKFEVEKIDFRPANVANDVTQLFYQTCPADKRDILQITTKVSADFPDAVRADPTRLRQILVNLMGNAVKFTQSGSVTLVCHHYPRLNQLKFEVVDTGIGIDKDTQSILFDEFVQADSSISRTYQGTGLGLAICKRLVKLMGGEIGIKSNPGEGSTFWFTLPYEPASPDAVLDDDTSDLRQEFIGTKRLSILVAEDNEINQIIIRSILTKMGHTVTMASNGLEAVTCVKKSDFDLILMDVRMPEMSGTDATRQIRKLPGKKASIPVIALTADVMAENKTSYIEAGMIDCVAKPIDQNELANAINRATQEKRAA